MSMYTDPEHLLVSDPGHLEGNTVFTYLDASAGRSILRDICRIMQIWTNWKAHYTRGGLGDVKVKKFLNNVMQETLEPIRNRRKELEKDIPAVYDILKKGSDEAREVAAQTLAEVKSAMRINYFDDAELIRMQSENTKDNKDELLSKKDISGDRRRPFLYTLNTQAFIISCCRN